MAGENAPILACTMQAWEALWKGYHGGQNAVIQLQRPAAPVSEALQSGRGGTAAADDCQDVDKVSVRLCGQRNTSAATQRA